MILLKINGIDRNFRSTHADILVKQYIPVKRMYDEYDHLSDNLWNLEQAEGESITDDFLNYIKVQTSYLENELEDFLSAKPSLDF